MDEIDIEGVARLGKSGLSSVGPIIVSLKLNVGARGQYSPPVTEKIAAAEFRILLRHGYKWRSVTPDAHPLSCVAVIEVALKRKCVAIVSFPIRSKAGLAHSPVVE